MAQSGRRVSGFNGLRVVGFPGLTVSILPTRDRKGLRITVAAPRNRTRTPNRGRPLSTATMNLRRLLALHQRRHRFRGRDFYALWLQKHAALSRRPALQTVAREIRRLGAVASQIDVAHPGRPLNTQTSRLRKRLALHQARGGVKPRAVYQAWLHQCGVSAARADQLLRREGRRIGGWPRANIIDLPAASGKSAGRPPSKRPGRASGKPRAAK